MNSVFFRVSIRNRVSAVINHLNYFNYFSEIEAAFIRRRGRNLLLSPLDWTLIESWQEREFPLHIILRGIENVFDAYEKNPNKRRAIRSLTYCRDEIEALHAEWLTSQVGKSQTDSRQGEENGFLPGEDFSPEGLSEHISAISSQLELAKANLEERSQNDLDEIIKKLDALEISGLSSEKLEEKLEELEALTDEILLRTAECKKFTKELTAKMSEYKTKMDAEAYERTFNLMLLKRLRDEKGIPRFSLFHL